MGKAIEHINEFWFWEDEDWEERGNRARGKRGFDEGMVGCKNNDSKCEAVLGDDDKIQGLDIGVDG